MPANEVQLCLRPRRHRERTAAQELPSRVVEDVGLKEQGVRRQAALARLDQQPSIRWSHSKAGWLKRTNDIVIRYRRTIAECRVVPELDADRIAGQALDSGREERLQLLRSSPG